MPHLSTVNDERLCVREFYKKCISSHTGKMEIRKREWLANKLTSGDNKRFWKGWIRIFNDDCYPKHVAHLVYLIKKKFMRNLNIYLRLHFLILGQRDGLSKVKKNNE